MIISSPAFKNNEYIPAKYTCDGEGISPPLEIGNVPQIAQSLVFFVDDPDAPSGNFVHWILWNIDPKTTLIKEGTLPEGAIEGQNSAGRNDYIPPCPPAGVHHYTFRLYVLDRKLEVSAGTTLNDLRKEMRGYIFGSAELVGLYRRQ
jgi:Raf kinase inhibitor-like YbhB/YbcL family protein